MVTAGGPYDGSESATEGGLVLRRVPRVVIYIGVLMTLLYLILCGTAKQILYICLSTMCRKGNRRRLVLGVFCGQVAQRQRH